MIWVMMTTRPFIKNTDKGFVFAQCTTFNKILHATARKYKNNSAIDIAFPHDKTAYFDLTGHLNGVGKSFLWRELNRQLRRIENAVLPQLNQTQEDVVEQYSSSKYPKSVKRSNNFDFRRLSLDNAFRTFDS